MTKSVTPLCLWDLFTIPIFRNQGMAKSLLEYVFKYEAVRPFEMSLFKPDEKTITYVQNAFGLGREVEPMFEGWLFFIDFFDNSNPMFGRTL